MLILRSHFDTFFQIIVSIRVILIATLRSIGSVPKTVVTLPKLPTWSFFFHTVIQVIRAYIQVHAKDIAVLRSVTDFPIIPTIPRSVYYWTETIRGVECEIIVPRFNPISKDLDVVLKSPQSPVCLYLHGGGFALCNPATHRPVTHGISEKSNAIVVVPHYRRIPDHSLQDALDDCRAVFDSLSLMRKICVCGDSAGGALAVMLTNEVRKRISCMALISPWCDFRDQLDDLHEEEGLYDFIAPQALRDMGNLVETCNLNSQLKSPMEIVENQHELDAIPIMIQVGGCETLIRQIFKFSKHVSSATVRVYEYMVHVPHFFSILHQEAYNAMMDLCEFFKVNHNIKDR